MRVLGLTGGIGMGKSAAGAVLSGWNIPVVDTDLIARQIVEPGQPALEELKAWFGPEIVDAEGQLRRAELARAVFGNDQARKKLEGILHPPIREIWQGEVARWREQGQFRFGVVVIPLLFETAAAASFDAVICVACSAASQRERLRTRGWDADEIENRIAAQWPVEKKMDLANYVVWTEGGLEVHAAQLTRIVPASE